MRFRRHSDGIEVLAPAKLNLFFEVLAKRPDGFHEVVTLMAPLDIYDTIVVREIPSADGSPEGPNRLGLCVDGWNANAAVCNRRSGKFRLVRSRRFAEGKRQYCGSCNRIATRARGCRPHCRSSFDEAHTVRRRIWVAGRVTRPPLWLPPMLFGNWAGPMERLGQLAAELGSDVPFFLHSGPAVCRGRGEEIEPVCRFGRLHVVVVRPPAGLSTAAVYRACRPSAAPRQVEPLLDALRRGDAREVGRRMHNGLETAAKGLSPWVERLAGEFAQIGLFGLADERQWNELLWNMS